MAKYFLATICFLGLILALPLPALANFNDVQFTSPTNIVLTSPALTFTVSTGSNVASLTVNPTNFQVGLKAGSSIVVTSADRQIMGNSLATTNCGTTNSTLTINYVAGVDQTITVTPSGTCPVSAPSPGVGGPTTTATGTVTVTPSDGGVTAVTSPDGTTATVSVPAGAVSAQALVTAVPVAAGTVSPVAQIPVGKSLVGNYVYNISASAAGVGAITSFAQNVTLNFKYTDAQIVGLNEATLAIHRWDGTKWVALTSTVNTATKTVTGLTKDFSYFAIVGEPAVDVPDEVVPLKPIAEMTLGELKAEIERISVLIGKLQAELAKLLPVSGAFTSNLYYGIKNNAEVKRLQEFLVGKGYLAAGLNTGNYLSLTVEAVKSYQSAKGITPVAGYFGPKTRAAVNAELGASQ